MDVYNVPEHGQGDAYLIQGTAGLNSRITTPVGETFEAMYNEGAPEFIVDQGLYYPTASATNYGYICTGLESSGDWADHHGVFGVDGQDFQFIGAQTENFPYVYYTPGYGYAQSPYNPYNPYIPGAMIGADGSFVGTQQYFIPSYENGASSPSYSPMVVQSGSETLTSSMTDQVMGTTASTANRVEASGFKRNLSSASAAFTLNPGRGASNHANSFPRVSEGLKSNVAPTKLPAAHSSVTFNSLSGPTSSQVLQGRGAQVTEDHSIGKALPNHNQNQLKAAFPSRNGSNAKVVVDNLQPKLPFGRSANDLNGNLDALSEQNRGPRTNKSKTQLTVKAYSTRAGNSDGQGNIIIYTDQYNKDDFLVDYANAKFFVIKSYSEDDVHKSIKYNVWSSTPNGNKKLNGAYEDAQKIAAGDPKGCPIFLFFSVNASGQFCGVAEMIGHVDFHRDMDFWQQDKWSGSFPVKWHIIKDVANPNFRHIILENNEHKPVTNSRDTQEIKYKKGLEMLKVFKNYVSKTSLLDDFMYYENRQKMMLEERARLLIKSYGTPVFVPVLDPPRKLNNLFDLHSTENEKTLKNNDLETPHNETAIAPPNSKQVVDGNTSGGDALKIGSLAISPKQTEPKPIGSLTISPNQTEPKHGEGGRPSNVVTVGSMEVKVNGSSGVKVGSTEVKVNGSSGVGSMEVKVNGSSGVLTVGTIPLDTKVVKVNKAGGSTNVAKTGAQKG